MKPEAPVTSTRLPLQACGARLFEADMKAFHLGLRSGGKDTRVRRPSLERGGDIIPSLILTR